MNYLNQNHLPFNWVSYIVTLLKFTVYGFFNPENNLTFMIILINRKTWIIFFAIIFMLQNLTFAQYQNARIANMTVTNTRDHLLLYLNIEGAFRDDTKKAILNGVPATFTFFTSLYQVRNFWFDSKIAEITTTHTIKYDNLKKEFIITRSSESEEHLVTKSFEEAQKLIEQIDGLKIVSLAKLKKGGKYQIRAKAERGKLTSPFYLHYASLKDFETDWHTTDFIY